MKKKLTSAGSVKSFAYKQLFLVMKITVFLIVFSVASVIANSGHSQETKLSVQLKDASLGKILNYIEDNSHYYFMYNNELIDLSRKVDIDVQNKSIDEILTILFERSGINYKIYNRQVVLSPQSQANAGFSFQQQVLKVSGKVTDASGEPLPGVSIVLKGTNTGVITDAQGNYSLSDVPSDAILVFSFVGMKSQEIAVAGNRNINVAMEEESIGIEEVVAIGYGTQKKASLTAAISTMNAEQIANIPTSNLSNILQGRMSGTYIRSSTGTPGVASEIKIRANTSYNSTPAIYVIDGVVRDATSFNALAPGEVENISVLKDAASAAIYGSRSSGGVVLVTTKTGKLGKPVVEFSSSLSTSEMVRLPRFADMNYILKIQKNNLGRSLGDDEIDWVLKNNPNGRNYFNTVYETPTNQNYTLSVSGGTDFIKYFIGGTFYDESGMLPQVWYKKYNLRGNVQVQITKDLSVGLNLSNSYGTRNKFASGGSSLDIGSQYYFLLIMDPFTVPYIDGNPVASQGWPNYAEVEKNGGYWTNPNQQIDALLTAEYKIPFIKGLSARVSYSKNLDNSFVKGYGKQVVEYQYKRSSTNNLLYTNEIIASGKGAEPGQEYIGNEYTKTNAYQFNTQLNYDQRFGNHHFNALAVYEQYEYSSNYFNGYRYTFPVFATDQYFAASADSKNWSTNGKEDQDGRLSYIGRVNYDYADKYLVSASIRRDGSIKFAPKKRWGNFPSLSLGWIISEENFFTGTKALVPIDFLKLRGSYASTGNDAIGGWQWLDQYNISGSSYYRGGGSGTTAPIITYGGTPNPNLTWEKSKTYDVGLDAVFAKNINFSFDYWKRHTYDILGARILAVPTEFGASLPTENYGEVNGHGFEIELGYKNKIGRDFSYQLTGNFSYATTKVKKWDFAAGIQQVNNPIGKTLSYFTGLQSLGIIRTQADLDKLPEDYNIMGAKPELGMLNFADIDGPLKDGKPDGKVDDYDKVMLGNYQGADNAPYAYGLNIRLTYRNFSLNMDFAGLAGFKLVYNDYYGRQLDKTQRFSTFYNNSWSTDNPGGTFPKMYPFGDSRATYRWQSNFTTFNGSFVRIKYLNLGYNIPQTISKRIGIGNIRLFAAGTNLFTLTKFKFYDPEIASFSSYPLTKSYSLGIDVRF